MNELISPKYIMKLVKEVDDAIWKEYVSYENVRLYINRWYKNNYEPNGFNNNFWENFTIIEKENNKIDLPKTLHSMDNETILKIAIDLGVNTPDFIPTVPTFKNVLKSDYKTAYDTFNKSIKLIETDPSTAIGLANSALESIIKEILKDERFTSKVKGNFTTNELARIIIKELIQTTENTPKEAKTICNNFISICDTIEKMRSEKTNFHGKTEQDFIIDEPIYAYLVINALTTVGLFLNNFYFNLYPKPVIEKVFEIDDLPF